MRPSPASRLPRRCRHDVGNRALGVVPEIISTAKGISSGYLPLGAVIVHEKIYQTLLDSSKGMVMWHGYTNTGNPACCAAGLKVLEIVERDRLIEHAEKMGERLHEGLRKLHSLPIVGDIRGLGLMAAVERVRNKETHEAFPAEAGVGAQFKRAAFDGGLRSAQSATTYVCRRRLSSQSRRST